MGTRFVTDASGVYQFDPDSLPTTYAYDASGNLVSETKNFGGIVFVKTYTYTGTQLTSESAWVKQ
ncbi:hypothetical protein [Paraburkholderia caribensis]|uniref:hypothetical protein n=1 Tax=Paraburkholderia caribensis TaxID=75105 RepID=UPI001CB4C4C4|nr:hypothetical protein [Paraburkholderia caribensis]CAG9256032.1 hypothetical protein PCAR4_40202 [Paraburkholderia caribensis]